MVIVMSFDSLPAELRIQVQDVINAYPPAEEVFSAVLDHTAGAKRRKIDADADSLPASLAGSHIVLQIPDLSVQSPIRKKLNIVFGCFAGERKVFLALTKNLESRPELLITDLSEANIQFAVVLDVPEKKQFKTLLITYGANLGQLYKNDPILINFNNDELSEQFGPLLEKTDLTGFLQQQFSTFGFKLVRGFGTDCFFVDAYKGSKEGYLYFLPSHVIFGFKKPILIFDSTNIESITYTSITRLTFNVTLTLQSNSERHEFSMIDQKEFEKIDQYVKSKELRDRSMTDELKAQRQLKNNADGPGALAEAAKLVPGGNQIVGKDEDDEDDENYESGSSSEEDSSSGEEEAEEEVEVDDLQAELNNLQEDYEEFGYIDLGNENDQQSPLG
ncbi:hypothetical protein OGAPHI_001125 [Ogataea philodendri]|uniref:Histone chaperone RTT106 n=1 Tax=Ogataea philodendri TaxID=1378263 RepID=A0A9P8T9S3_9ASCO|nr:uncharacterized protein OGAPHI_001125 [Ogataea philodendri]KAH3670610.1 hypothetical protein OGAPHI_001125 [Ogataea philodendri]